MGDDASPKKPKSSTSDVVLIHGVTKDGQGLEVLRAREQRLEFGQVRRLEHGRPLQGDVVKLRPRQDMPFVCDVETEVSVPSSQRGEEQRGEGSVSKVRPTEPKAESAQASARKGPAQVASSAYRQNWDVIWSGAGRKKDDFVN